MANSHPPLCPRLAARLGGDLCFLVCEYALNRERPIRREYQEDQRDEESGPGSGRGGRKILVRSTAFCQRRAQAPLCAAGGFERSVLRTAALPAQRDAVADVTQPPAAILARRFEKTDPPTVEVRTRIRSRLTLP
jgi:hypothetical protein